MGKKRGRKGSTLESAVKSGSNFKKPQTVEVIIKKKVLGEAPVEHHFVVADGKKLKKTIRRRRIVTTRARHSLKICYSKFLPTLLCNVP